MNQNLCENSKTTQSFILFQWFERAYKQTTLTSTLTAPCDWLKKCLPRTTERCCKRCGSVRTLKQEWPARFFQPPVNRLVNLQNDLCFHEQPGRPVWLLIIITNTFIYLVTSWNSICWTRFFKFPDRIIQHSLCCFRWWRFFEAMAKHLNALQPKIFAKNLNFAVKASVLPYQ